MGMILVLAALIAAAAYLIFVYNGIVQLRNNVDKAWSNIDVLLKQRFDEVPRLVEVCKGYMTHERATLEAVARARADCGRVSGAAETIEAQNRIGGALRSLFAVVENYPALRADESFRQLQSRISEIEDMISDRREFYNESVNLHNTRIEQFPDLIVAGAFSFASRPLWKIDPRDRAIPEVRVARNS